MKFDVQLQRDVLTQLEWEPGINAAQIAVTAKDGVVTLSGSVDSYAQKLRAERATTRVRGVNGIANEIIVLIPEDAKRNDTEIAEAAVQALRWDTSIPEEQIVVTVRNGWVLLHGKVGCQYQRLAAAEDVGKLAGVRGVSNHIEIEAPIARDEIRKQIEDALKRSAEIASHQISVEANNGTATLRGNVRSWKEREEAEFAAWAAPGIVAVDNCLNVVQ